MSKFKVLIADYTYSTLEPEKKVLETADAEVITAQCRTEEDVIEAAHGVDGIICQYAPISKKVIDQLATCKIVARYGVGFDTIDVPAATEKGIMVTNVTDYSLDEVSNHAFALLMAPPSPVLPSPPNKLFFYQLLWCPVGGGVLISLFFPPLLKKALW